MGKGVIIDLILILIILNSSNLISIDALNPTDSSYQIQVNNQKISSLNYDLNYHYIQKGGEFMIAFDLGNPNGPVSFEYKTPFPVVKHTGSIYILNNSVSGTVDPNSDLEINHKIDHCINANQVINFDFKNQNIGTTNLDVTIQIISKGDASCNPIIEPVLSSIISNPFYLILIGLIIYLIFIIIMAITNKILKQEKGEESDELYPEE